MRHLLESPAGFARRKRCKECSDTRKGGRSLDALVKFFLERCEVTPEDCMLPLGVSRDKGGYVNISFKGRCTKLHRLVLKHKLGRPIKEECEAMHSHLCEGRRDCINPEHIREGTHSENIKMAYASGRKVSPFKDKPRQRRKVNVKTADLVRNFYARNLHSQQKLAKMFGVSRTTISNIVHRKMHYRDNKPIAP